MFVEEKAKGEVPDFKLGTLRLSTAMRIGARLRPQAKGGWYIRGSSCAIGAAFEGRYGRIPRMSNMGEPLMDEHRLLREAFPCIGGGSNLYTDVFTRNDYQGWTREQIADWLESQGL